MQFFKIIYTEEIKLTLCGPLVQFLQNFLERWGYFLICLAPLYLAFSSMEIKVTYMVISTSFFVQALARL